MNRTETLGRVALLVLALTFCWLRFPDFFEHPDWVVEPYGDGFKAYTVIAFHARFDTALHHFEGMNYPYGDHALSSATQPLISNSIHLLRDWTGLDFSLHTIAIVNWSMLISLVLGAFFLYLIFRRYQLPIWLSILVALGMVALSPQIHRMHAHYGLSHIMVLPGLLYGLMRYEERPGWMSSMLVGLWVTACSLIHFYFFAIQVFTVSLYFLIRIIQRWDWKALLYYGLHYGIQIGLPLAFFLYWIYGNETVDDRTGQPWGFFHFHSFLSGILTSNDQPHWAWIDQHVVNLDATVISNFEGRTYLGLMALITLMVSGVYFLRKRNRQVLALLPEGRYFIANIFLTGFALLVFSFGIPFTWKGWEGLLDYTGPLRQFRSMGRFAWTFYYAINIAAWVWLYHLLKGKSIRYVVWGAGLFLLLGEAYFHNRARDLRLDAVDRFISGNRFTDLNGIDYTDYQAIVTVPYYNIGSDQFWWEGEGYILQNSLALSMQTGLPVTSAMLTRTSRRQTLNQLQLVTEPYREPVILNDFKDERPLLMVLDEREYQKEKKKYHHLLKHARLVFLEGDRLRLYALPLSAFAKNLNERFDAVSQRLADSTLLTLENGMRCDTLIEVVRQNFDNHNQSEAAYQGVSGKVHQMHPDSVLAQVRLPAKAGAQWLFRGWFYIDMDRRTRADLRLEEKNKEGQSLQVVSFPLRKAISVFDHNGWAMAEWPLTPKADGSIWEVRIIGEHMPTHDIWVDEWLWAPEGIDLYWQDERFTWWNNRFYPR